MLKRKQKPESTDTIGQKPERAGENTLGIDCSGNHLHRYWLLSTGAAVLAVLAFLAFLVLLRNPALQAEQVTLVAGEQARQQAAVIESLLADYRGRLRAAANSPLALAAIASRSPEDLALVEKALLDYFPRLTSMRLIGVDENSRLGIEEEDLGLRNHIELDMVRNTAAGTPSEPESYQFEDKWLTSFAELVQHPRETGQGAVVLATLDNRVFESAMEAFSGEMGRASLQQVYGNGGFRKTTEIAAVGSGAAEEFVAEAQLGDSSWIVVFTPSARMLSHYHINSVPILSALAVLGVCILLAQGLFLYFHERDLKSQAELMLKAAESKNALTLSLPPLLPVARALRKSAQRPGKPASGAQDSRPGPRPVKAVEEQLADKLAREQPAQEVSGGADIPPHIFRAYDIRGKVDSELDNNAITMIGLALGTLAGEMGEQAFVVGFDGRISSPTVKATFVKALLDSGRDVVDIGIVPTPALHFAIESVGVSSGVMVTASHNPADYNGFKITLGGRPLAGEDLQNLRGIIQKGAFSEGKGRLAKKDIRTDYIDAIVDDIAITAPIKIVVDAGNGAAGELAPRVLEGLSCEVERLYCDIDGTFPNHHPDPSIDANLADLQTAVPELGADFGVAYDGDGDRLSIVTAEGEIVRNDLLMMLFAQDIVSRNPGADVVFDIKCTRQLTQLVSKHGGRPLLWKTGHAFMREKVRESGALLGGEFAGHFYFGERWFGFDDAIYATARLAELVSGSGLSLSELLAEFPRLANTPEIHIPVSEQEKFQIMEMLAGESDFSPGKVTTLDGIRVDFNDGWGLLRASNTTPALVARFEGHSEEALARIMQQFRDELSKQLPDREFDF